MEKTTICMLIDDDDDEHEIFREALSQTLLPVRCLFAFNCPTAIKLISSDEKSIPEFIFMDWNLGGIQGMDCLNQLNRVIPDNCQLIVYSGLISQQTLDELKQYNYHFFQKTGSIKLLAKELKLIFETASA
ncbi:response regulator [Dyadobacter sp.]|uniref:response regulator n=1 Tax=Dyadobacter sp. TaxID=1914288 RepID=UPI0032674364